MEINKLKNILEAVLLAADRTLSVIQMEALFELDEERPTRDEIRKALHEMAEDYEARGYELKQVSSGFRLQVRQQYATWVGRLWEERPARYTRALLETMALIAYRQPVTRGEIEEVRGVSVSSNIIKTLLERNWIKVLGHKDVPGKPSLYGSTREFLDYFNLKSLDQLPTLAEIKDLQKQEPQDSKVYLDLQAEKQQIADIADCDPSWVDEVIISRRFDGEYRIVFPNAQPPRKCSRDVALDPIRIFKNGLDLLNPNKTDTKPRILFIEILDGLLEKLESGDHELGTKDLQSIISKIDSFDMTKVSKTGGIIGQRRQCLQLINEQLDIIQRRIDRLLAQIRPDARQAERDAIRFADSP